MTNECCATTHCEHWREFDVKMILARTRNNLIEVAHQAAERLRRDRVTVNAESLRDSLIAEVAQAHPRSALVAWHIEDAVVERLINVAVRDFLGARV
jgi:hypothetical protein